MKFHHAAAAAALIGMVATFSAAQASTIGFAGDDNVSVLGPLPVGATTVTVTPDTFDDEGGGFLSLNNDPDALIRINEFGLGIDNGGFSPDNNDVDGSEDNDILIFTFGKRVQLDAIEFSKASSNDDFVVFAVNSLADLSGLIAFSFLDIVDQPDQSGSFTFVPPLEGLIFGIGALELNDEFRVAGLHVSPIPLPAPLLMLLTGLAGLGWLGRTRRAPA